MVMTILMSKLFARQKNGMNFMRKLPKILISKTERQINCARRTELRKGHHKDSLAEDKGCMGEEKMKEELLRGKTMHIILNSLLLRIFFSSPFIF